MVKKYNEIDMKKIAFTSIRTNLTFWFLILALVPLILAMVIIYNVSSKAFEERSFDKLTAIRDLKVGQLESWIGERNGDFRTFTENTDPKLIFEAITTPDTDPSNDALEQKIRDVLYNYQKTYMVYEEIYIINTQTDLVEISTNIPNEDKNKKGENFYSEALKTTKICVGDVHYSPETGKNILTLSSAIYNHSNNSQELIGVLVANVDLSVSLYPLLLNRTGLGKTGETLIVNKNGVALNELRGYQNAPLQLKIKAEPAVYASQGKTGIIKSVDYSGVPVLAAYTYIPETDWGFVCKQDLSELNESMKIIRNSLFLLFILSVIAILSIVYLLSKSISKPIVALNVHAKKFRDGDFSARNMVSSADELGSLASEFNNMSAVIESKLKIQKSISDISDQLIKQSSLQDFGSELLRKLMKITGANMSTLYVLNEATSEYEHFTSIGANIELLKPFNAEHPQGEFGNVLSNKEIYYLNNIPDGTGFIYNTTAGDILPKEMITIPVVVDDAVVALISLVNRNQFSIESYDTIELSWAVINTTYSNLLASERTRIFADMLNRNNQELEAQSEELQEQSEELQAQTQELQQKSEELQQQNIELEAQKKQVESANQLKSEFLSNMSHELRTPLNSIMALSQVLIMQTKNILDKEQYSYLEIVRRNGKNLLSLINDILDLSKIEAGKMEIIPKPMSVGQLLEITKENLMSLAALKNIQLELTVPAGLPKIESDETKLHQVLTNIVGNAVKFTEEGSVKILVKQNAENVFISVSDTGIGISKEMLPHVFDEFRQGDGTTSRRYEGTGLGLAIAYKITKVLGGDIKVESVLGEGSVFTIRIPIGWHENIQALNSNIEFISPTSPTNGSTILVVDDDPVTVQMISTYLKEEGFNTLIAHSGKEALQLAEKHQPFAITLDVIMPEMDGWEVLQKLKSNTKTKHIPVIAISVSNERDTGFALGAVGYIQKPIDRKILISEIKKVVEVPESVLIVDDNEFERNEMAKIIESEQMNTVLAKDGKECLKILKTKIPDVLVLDLMMPGINGFEVIKSIRANDQTKDLPVIVVTAKDLSVEDKASLSGKISSMITKSEATQQELFHEIKRVIEELKAAQKSKISINKTHQTRILMVEDNPEAIIQVKTVLEKEQYLVDVAGGGQEALDYVAHTIPDGIILDLMMPGIDGFEVLEKVRNTERTKQIPVLILTAKDLTKNDLAKLSANNIQQLIHKGDVDIDGLLFKVKMMLGAIPKTISIAETVEPAMPEIKQVQSTQKAKGRSDNGLPDVLIVEDNPDNMVTIKAILKEKFNITEAYNGETGIALAESLLPDIILLDISLPGLSGEEVIALVKSNEKTKAIPVIAVTAQVMMGDKERFLKLGCDGYVPKPIDQEELLGEIGRLLSR